jgi:hypothetical protein
MIMHVAEASSKLQILSQELSSLLSCYMQTTHTRSQGAMHRGNRDLSFYSLVTTDDYYALQGNGGQGS